MNRRNYSIWGSEKTRAAWEQKTPKSGRSCRFKNTRISAYKHDNNYYFQFELATKWRVFFSYITLSKQAIHAMANLVHGLDEMES